MKLENLNLLAAKAYELGVYAMVKKRYSGRGMFGKETPAIVVERRATFLRLAILVGSEQENCADFIDDISAYSVDNMGRDFIFY